MFLNLFTIRIPHIYLRKLCNRRNAICISDVEVITIRLHAFVVESWIPKIAVTVESQTVFIPPSLYYVTSNTFYRTSGNGA